MAKNSYLVALGKEIRRRRKELGHSQEGFALDNGIDRSFFGGMERGERNITMLNLIKVANALGVTPSVLLADAEKNLAMP